jgi:hypothetical protein
MITSTRGKSGIGCRSGERRLRELWGKEPGTEGAGFEGEVVVVRVGEDEEAC